MQERLGRHILFEQANEQNHPHTKSVMSAYLLIPVEGEQSPADTTFIGGYPCLPAGMELPYCAFCGELQSFFFQVSFPADHIWADYSLAVFQCTSCDPNEFIPMLYERG